MTDPKTRPVRLPNGKTVIITEPPAEFMEMIEKSEPGRRPWTPEERMIFSLWISSQPIEYQAFMLDSLAMTSEIRDALDMHPRHPLQNHPMVEGIRMQMFGRIANNRLGMCVHVRRNAPNPAVWVPFAPNKARCVPCNTLVANGVRGTKEDRRCDVCKRIRASLVTCELFESSVTIRHVIVPVIIAFGICKRCLDTAISEVESEGFTDS